VLWEMRRGVSTGSLERSDCDGDGGGGMALRHCWRGAGLSFPSTHGWEVTLWVWRGHYWEISVCLEHAVVLLFVMR
jgi:hypothetical protein